MGVGCKIRTLNPLLVEVNFSAKNSDRFHRGGKYRCDASVATSSKAEAWWGWWGPGAVVGALVGGALVVSASRHSPVTHLPPI